MTRTGQEAASSVRLTYHPALALGPVLEQLELRAQRREGIDFHIAVARRLHPQSAGMQAAERSPLA